MQNIHHYFYFAVQVTLARLRLIQNVPNCYISDSQ